YIAFSSTTHTENGTEFLSFSPFFKLDQMSGSFSSALDSATSSLEVPSALTASGEGAPSSTSMVTITVGTLSTSVSTSSTEPTEESASSTTTPSSSSSSPSLSPSSDSQPSTPTSTAIIQSGFTTLTIPPVTSSQPLSTATVSTGTAEAASTPSNSARSSIRVPISLPLVGVLSFSSLFLCLL
ncbi:hypothetical protein AAF712_006061, partial [Marasmius tenuissimus]